MKNLEIKTVTIKAFVIYDKTEKVFTVYLKDKGGPIISAKKREDACKKFEEAINLSCAVQNLAEYSNAVENFEKTERKVPEFNYIDKQVA